MAPGEFRQPQATEFSRLREALMRAESPCARASAWRSFASLAHERIMRDSQLAARCLKNDDYDALAKLLEPYVDAEAEAAAAAARQRPSRS